MIHVKFAISLYKIVDSDSNRNHNNKARSSQPASYKGFYSTTDYFISYNSVRTKYI